MRQRQAEQRRSSFAFLPKVVKILQCRGGIARAFGHGREQRNAESRLGLHEVQEHVEVDVEPRAIGLGHRVCRAPRRGDVRHPARDAARATTRDRGESLIAAISPKISPTFGAPICVPLATSATSPSSRKYILSRLRNSRLAFSFSEKNTVPAATLSSLPADSKKVRATAGM